MLRYILVPANGYETDASAFRVAIALAHIDGAHLVFLHVRPDVEKLVVPIASAEFGSGAGIGELIEALEREAIVRHDQAKRAVHSFCAEAKIPMSSTPVDDMPTAEWRLVIGDELDQLAAAGRAADLLVLGRMRGDKPVSADLLNASLMETGRPLLMVPSLPSKGIGKIIAIAWKDTAEAASAVAAALPLLAGARQVVILSVTEDVKADEAACARLREALIWHNRATTVQHLARIGSEPADVLLKSAADVGADLLVMGGYSRSRMREVTFGNFTRRILQAADLPVFLAH
jgi:nucleotide-binding universal stress UspA family protein